jgi:hypothetical protein
LFEKKIIFFKIKYFLLKTISYFWIQLFPSTSNDKPESVWVWVGMDANSRKKDGNGCEWSGMAQNARM